MTRDELVNLTDDELLTIGDALSLYAAKVRSLETKMLIQFDMLKEAGAVPSTRLQLKRAEMNRRVPEVEALADKFYALLPNNYENPHPEA